MLQRLYPCSRKALLFAAGALATLCPLTNYAQNLSVVVPALAGNKSRPAHFNWTFESAGGGDVRIGQFACGSYWIAPAEGDSSVKLLSLTGNPEWTDYLSVDTDPLTERHGLLSGAKNYGNYDASENLLANLPATITPQAGSCVSLVAAMQRNEAETSPGGTASIVGEVADAYCVITVLPEPPPNGGADMIRPNITGQTKEFLTWDDFDLSILRSYDFIEPNSSATWDNVRIRWSHSIEIFGGFSVEVSPGKFTGFSEGGRAFRAHILHHDYASGMARTFNNDVMALLAPGDMEERKPALAAMLAFANDLYHARYDYGDGPRRAYTSGAGQHSGKFLPMVLLAALQKDDAKDHQLRKVAIYNHGADRGELGPQEIRQIIRGMTGVHIWGDGFPIFRNGNEVAEADRRYWADFRASRCYDSALGECNASVGNKAAGDPYLYHDGPANKPGSSYFGTSAGATRALAALMILVPEVRSIVNTDAPIEYTDRKTRHGLWTYPDPIAAISDVDQTAPCDPWRWGRDCMDYGELWGPDPFDVRRGIEDGVGRFVSMHGNPAPTNQGYESERVYKHWNEIIAYYDGPTYEDTFVPLGVAVAPDIFFETGDAPRLHLWTPNLDAEIRYTLDGSEPTSSSALYEGPVPVELGVLARARTYVEGMVESPVSEKAFVLTVSQPDAEAPSIPTNLSASNITETSVRLEWSESTDNIGVSGYAVYRDGDFLQNVVGQRAVTVGNLSPGSTYLFTVAAYDAVGNQSAQSTAVAVTTLGGSQTTTWAGFPIVDGIHVDTQELLGWIMLGNSNWVWSWDLGIWIYLPEDAVTPDGAWSFFGR